MMTSTRRRKQRSDEDGERPLFEKALFSIMGPAQIGEDRAPDGYVPDDTANYCPKCQQPWTEHERVHSSNMTYTVCPKR